MSTVYVIVNHGDVSPNAYATYAAAVAAVNETYATQLDHLIAENPDDKDEYIQDLHPAEDDSGVTVLAFMQRTIRIHRLNVVSTGGRRRRKTVRRYRK